MFCYGYSPEAIGKAVGETEKFASTYHTRRIFDAMSDLIFNVMSYMGSAMHMAQCKNLYTLLKLDHQVCLVLGKEEYAYFCYFFKYI